MFIYSLYTFAFHHEVIGQGEELKSHVKAESQSGARLKIWTLSLVNLHFKNKTNQCPFLFITSSPAVTDLPLAEPPGDGGAGQPGPANTAERQTEEDSTVKLSTVHYMRKRPDSGLL